MRCRACAANLGLVAASDLTDYLKHPVVVHGWVIVLFGAALAVIVVALIGVYVRLRRLERSGAGRRRIHSRRFRASIASLDSLDEGLAQVPHQDATARWELANIYNGVLIEARTKCDDPALDSLSVAAPSATPYLTIVDNASLRAMVRQLRDILDRN